MPERSPPCHRHAPAGFTLIECLIALCVAAILSIVAYPSLLDQIRKGRRSDAFAAMADVQAAQGRWRSSHLRYAASWGELGLSRDTSAQGHYRLQLTRGDAGGFSVHAQALGSQALDRPCNHLRVTVRQGAVIHESGASSSVGNGPSQNRACWRM